MKNAIPAVLKPEEKHHDEIAQFYSQRRKRDYLWEIPEHTVLLRTPYLKKGVRIIDMGCGPAISVRRALHKLGLDNRVTYTGVDVSKNMLKEAKKQIPYGTYVHSDIQKTGLKPGSFDTLISLGSLHHSLDKRKTFLHWHGLLKAGGYMLLREPTYESLKQGTGESPLEEGVKAEELLALAGDKGMEVVQMAYINTKVFHAVNRIAIKLGFHDWQKHTLISVPFLYVEMSITNVTKNTGAFEGDTFLAVLRK